MPRFNELNQQEILALLNAKDENGNLLYQDVLTPLIKKEEELFRSSPCPKCGSAATSAVLNTRKPFSPESPLPNKILRCVICSTEYDPRTGLITYANIIDASD